MTNKEQAYKQILEYFATTNGFPEDVESLVMLIASKNPEVVYQCLVEQGKINFNKPKKFVPIDEYTKCQKY